MTEQEARAEARIRAEDNYPGGLSVDGILQRGYEHGFKDGAAWERARLSSRVVEAAPSDTEPDREDVAVLVAWIRDLAAWEHEHGSDDNADRFDATADALSRTPQPVQVEPLWETKPDGSIGPTEHGLKVWNGSQPVQVEPWKSEHLKRAERVGDALNGVLVDAGIFDSDAVEEYNNLINDLVNAVLAALGGGDHAE